MTKDCEELRIQVAVMAEKIINLEKNVSGLQKFEEEHKSKDEDTAVTVAKLAEIAKMAPDYWKIKAALVVLGLIAAAAITAFVNLVVMKSGVPK